MKNQILHTLLVIFFSSRIVSAQPPATGTMVPGIVFSYDPTGKRILRQPGLVCFGCKQSIQDTLLSDYPLKDIRNAPQFVEAYPNPVSSELVVNNSNWQQKDIARIEVSDILGRILIKKQITQAKDVILFSGFTAGTYFVNYYLNGGSNFVWKIVKL